MAIEKLDVFFEICRGAADELRSGKQPYQIELSNIFDWQHRIVEEVEDILSLDRLDHEAVLKINTSRLISITGLEFLVGKQTQTGRVITSEEVYDKVLSILTMAYCIGVAVGLRAAKSGKSE